MAAEFQFVQQKPFTFYARTAIEGRFFSNREDQFKWRNRVGIDIKLTNKTTLKPFYEIFHQISKGKPLTLDQMRFNTSVKHQFFKIMSAEMGYIRLLNPIGIQEIYWVITTFILIFNIISKIFIISYPC